MIKKLLLILIVLILAGCAGMYNSDDDVSSSTTYNAVAAEGELLEYTLDVTNLTYSYKVTSSALGINNDTHTGTLIKNADGTYTPSLVTNAKVLILPNKLVVGVTKLNINGSDRYTLIVGVPTTTNVQFSDISGAYNYVSLQCLTSACNNSTGDPESAYGTFNIDTSGNWVECTRSNYTANPSNCAGRDSGTLNSLGNGRFQILSGSTDMGTGMFYHSPSGQKIMIVDLKNYLGNYGRGMIFGVPQKAIALGASIDGEYFVNTTKDYFVKSTVSGNIYTESGVNYTITVNTPWIGLSDVAGGYAILADEGTFMWAPKSSPEDRLAVGLKK